MLDTSLLHVQAFTTKGFALEPATAELFAKLSAACPVPTTAGTQAVLGAIVDQKRYLGKQVEEHADGSITKSARVATSEGVACQFHVPDAETMARVLEIVGTETNVAIIKGIFEAVPLGEPFLILSVKALRERGLDPEGVHEIDGMKVLARAKIHCKASSWVLFDRDMDGYTPEQFRGDYATWVSQADELVPGFPATTRVRVESSSARVILPEGTPYGGGNGHTWFQVDDPNDVPRFRAAIMARAIEQGKSWKKPRHSKTDGSVVGYGDATIIDPAVLNAEGLVFDGAPTVKGNLTVAPPVITITRGTQDRLDTSKAVASPLRTFRASAKTGAPVRIRNGGTCAEIVRDLTLETLIELADGTVHTVAELLPAQGEKMRCQTPFRASESVAAVLFNKDGDPCLFDSGTNQIHVLKAAERPVDPVRDKLIREMYCRLGALIGQENAVAVLNEDAVADAFDGSFFQPSRNVFSMLNRDGGMIELNAADSVEFGFRKSFGSFFDRDMLDEVIAEMSIDAKAEKEIRAKLKSCEVRPLIEALKITRQARTLKMTVDLFARSSSITCADGVACIVLPHIPLRASTKIEVGIVDAVLADYREHFPDFDAFLGFLLHSRFSADRRHSFLWLHCMSDWGKGFLLAVFKSLGLVCEVSTKEIDSALAGSPVGLSAESMLRAWILFVDEFKSVSSELKQLNNTISLSAKYALKAEVPLFAKVFASAENVRSLTGEGVEAQFDNRFAYLSPTSNPARLDERVLFRSLGKDLYRRALSQYVAEYLNDGVIRLRASGRFEASKVSDEFCQNYQMARKLSAQFGSLDDSVDEVADELREMLVEAGKRIQKGEALDWPLSCLSGLPRPLLDKLKAKTTVGYLSVVDRLDGKAVLILSHADSIIRGYLDLIGDKSVAAKLGYKVGEIAADLDEGSSPDGRVHYYLRDGDNRKQKRGIVISLSAKSKGGV